MTKHTSFLVLFAACLLHVLIFTTQRASACCADDCSGHGMCTTGTCTCSCFGQFTGENCSQRKCAYGIPWSGSASATDTIRASNTECSSAGKCDVLTGLCSCQDGFSGMACERMDCPLGCSNAGRCVSLAEAGTLRDDRHFVRTLTYSTPWDAGMIFGCMCDIGYSGHDCSVRECVYGDDPVTAGVNEEQVVHCDCGATCSGNFYLTFRGETTAAIAHDATAAAVEAALEAILSINDVTVTFTSGAAACSATGEDILIEFVRPTGSTTPLLRLDAGTLASSGGTVTLDLYHSGTTGPQGAASVKSTKEWLECNGRGVCDRTTGLCVCTTAFSSSDGAGGIGTLGDCGYTTGASSCPGISSCSGYGTCDGNFQCTCFPSHTGADCSLRTCPVGKAWFAEPGNLLPGFVSVSNAGIAVTTTVDLRSYLKRGDTIVIGETTAIVSPTSGDTFDATTVTLSAAFGGSTVSLVEAYSNPNEVHHHLVECSGRGLCGSTTGVCTCDLGFEGNACQTLSCPSTTSLSECSGHGRCLSLERLAEDTLENGVATTYTYGQTIGSVDTWDYNRIQGCKCDTALLNVDDGQYDFGGHDCSLRYCKKGDDPSTAGVDEVQTITCTLASGTFTVTFREETTDAIAFSATTTDVETALEALSTIGAVSVTFSSSQACLAGSNDIVVTFLDNHGDLPDMSTNSGSAVVVETTPGTKESTECSAHGLCDRTLGICECFKGYVSSNGQGGRGTKSDCGYRDALSS